jgi:hypothetical protein
MRLFGISGLLFGALVVFGCGGPQIDDEPPGVPEALPVAIEETSARSFSDSVIKDLLNDDRDGLFSKIETPARDYYKVEGFNTLIGNLFETYGKPLSVEYKKNMVGRRSDAVGSNRPMRKFWYSVETTKYKKGTHFVFVEVVREGDQLSSSAFAIVNFPMGVPDDMK